MFFHLRKKIYSVNFRSWGDFGGVGRAGYKQPTREPTNSWDSPHQGYSSSSSLENGKAIEIRQVQSCAQAER